MLLVYITVISSLVCFILYVGDRRMREEPIDWITALKVSAIGALLSGGAGYAISGEVDIKDVKQVVEAAQVPEVAQEMFVGVPTF
jgi:acyl-coenzyme A synthetase/AMP-(fatty) acid ligase